MKIKILVILFSFLFPLFVVVPVFASTSLDSTYGTNGSVITSFGNNSSPIRMALQNDGKAVVVGYQNNGSVNGWVIARYNTDGTLDSTFGTNGIATKFFSGNSALEAVAIQTDGKIVVGGYSYNGAQCNGGNSCWTVARYNADGSLDTSFGSNGGIIVTNITSANCCGQQVQAITIQPSDGKIVAAGSTRDLGVVRYNTDGSVDFIDNIQIPWNYWDPNCPPVLGGGGCTNGPDGANQVAVRQDGKIVIAGSYGQYASANNNYSFIFQLNADGSFDTTFGKSGIFYNVINGIAKIFDMALQPDGNIIVTGEQSVAQDFSAGSIFLARITPTGTYDSSFGNGGIVIPNFGMTPNGGNTLLIEPGDNKIIVGGFIGSNLMLSRFNTDGSIDISFGTNGIFQPSIGSGGVVRDLVIQSDYKLVASANISNGSYSDWGIFRTEPVVDTIQIAASPSTGTFHVGQPTTINIVVTDSNVSNPFNAAGATVTVSPNLTITGINNPATNSCNFNYTVSPTKSDPSFAGAIYNGSKTNCTVYTMTVTPNATGTGTITFTDAQIKAYADGSEILTGIQNGSFTIAAAIPTPTPAGTTLVTVDDSIQGTGLNQWNYVGSGWHHCTDTSNPACNPNLYNDSVSWNNTVSDTSTITFNGRQIILYGLVDPNHGEGTVSIDGGPETTINFNATTRKGDVQLWTSPLLPLGQHTLTLRVSSGYIALDRADIIQNSPSDITVTNPYFVTYGPTFTITGTKNASITHVFVNGSESGVTYPTSTTWQAVVPVVLGNNSFTIYGKDDNDNQTASIPVAVNMHKLGDINGDTLVDLTDASLFAVDYGKTDPNTFVYPLSDMNNNGRVDLQDLSILAKNEQ